MAAIKVRFRKSAIDLENYIKNKQSIGDSVDCNSDDVSSDFLLIQKLHNKTIGNESLHIIQSWSLEESQQITPQIANGLGLELAQRAYPDHQIYVGTHTDTKLIHNHIMANPVNSNTGKRIYNKTHEEKRVRLVENDFAREKGMHVIIPSENTKNKSIPLQINKDGRFSYNMDIEQKALFASRYAKNFQEHTQILNELGLVTKVQNKNTSYRHFDRAKFKRGAKLNDSLTQDALLKKFEENKIKFKNQDSITLAYNCDEFNQLKAITIQQDLIQKRNLQMNHIVKNTSSYKHIKKEKWQGIVLINEHGEKFFISQNDKIFNALLEKSEKFKNHIINNADSKQLFSKSGKMVFKTDNGHEIWIDKKTDPKAFSENKIGGYFNLYRFKHYYLNSNYKKNNHLNTSKKDCEIYQKQDLGNIEKIITGNSYIDEIELLEHEKKSTLNKLIAKHKNVNFIFKNKTKGFEKIIEETLSR
jgi:YD repeat-containing protein